MLAILYADRGDRRKLQSLHRAHLAIFADRGDRRIKSPGVSLALEFLKKYITFYFEGHVLAVTTAIVSSEISYRIGFEIDTDNTT